MSAPATRLRTSTLLRGDARRLPLADACVDAVVADPPYGLHFMGKAWDRPSLEQAAQGDERRRTLGPHSSSRPGRSAPRASSGFGNDAGNAGAYDFSRNAGFQRWSEVWAVEALRVLKPGGHLIAFGGTRTHHRLWCAVEDAGFEIRDTAGFLGLLGWIFGSGFPKSAQPLEGMLSLPRTTTRAQWRAFHRRARQMNGTALKPAWEPILLARKPLLGTVAQNVLRFGVGGLTIGGCRIALDGEEPPGGSGRNDAWRRAEGRTDQFQGNTDTPVEGRWPANVVLDEGAAAALDAAVGELPGPGNKPESLRSGQGDDPFISYAGWGGYAGGPTTLPYEHGGGGPSRFYYIAKASRAEREAGLEGLPPARRSDGRAKEIENPRLRTSERRNDHPTVKPLALMRWLVRLVTPPGGLVLDPFLGSGTTGMAALDEGFRFVGLDLDAHYLAIARRRIDHRHGFAADPVGPTSERLQGALL